MMQKKLTALLVIISFSCASCASYRVVPLARGADSEGNIHQFYAVAQNNVIIPEYVINERGEYPIDRNTAWERFQLRQAELEPKMVTKYRIPSNGANGIKQFLLGLGFLIVFPISYPIYAFSNPPGKRSVGSYFDLMANGPSANPPVIRDDLANF